MKNYQIALKNSIIDGANIAECLWNTEEVSKIVISFIKEITRLLKLHIDGTDFYANCKG